MKTIQGKPKQRRKSTRPLDAKTVKAILAAPEKLTRGDKNKTPAEMWHGFKTFDGIRDGVYTPPESIRELCPENMARRGEDASFELLEGLISHPAVFHTPLHEKGDYIFAMLHTNLMTLRVDGRCKEGVLKTFPLKTFGTAFAVGNPARLPDYSGVRFSCHNGLPLVTAKWQQADAELTLDSFVVGASREIPGSYEYNRVLWEKLTIHNPLRKTLRLTIYKCFAEALRASFGMCHYNRLNGYPTTAWQEGSLRLDKKGDELYRDGALICRVDRPRNVQFKLAAFAGDRHVDSFRTREKVACFTVTLKPGATTDIKFRTCFADQPWQGAAVRVVRSLDYNRERAKCIRRWKGIIRTGAQLKVPEKRVMDVWRAQQVCLHQFHHRFVETDEVLFPNQGPAWPMSLWAGEARFCIRAFDQLGLHVEAEKIIEYFIRKQIDWIGPFKSDVNTLSGAFDSSFHWMQDTGVMLGAMGRHYLLSGDKKWLHAKKNSVLMGLDWIHTQRLLTRTKDKKGQPVRHYGLLPNARANDGDDHGYFYAFTDCPTWDGVDRIVAALGAAGIELPEHLSNERDDYRRCLKRTIGAVMNLFPGTDFVPHVVYPPKGKQPWAWAASMMIGLGSRAVPRSSSLFKELYAKVDRYLSSGNRQVLGLCDRMDDVMLCDAGGPRCGIKGTEWYVIAAERERHRMYLEGGEIEKALLSLYTLLAFTLTDTLQSNERINLIDPYWAPVQVNPSGSARLISMIGESIVLDMDRHISFFCGIPRAWLKPNKEVLLKDWKTTHGAVSCSVRVDQTGDCMKGEVRIADMRGRLSGDIVLRHPTGKSIKSATVNGRVCRTFRKDRLLLDRLSDKMTFAVHW